MAAASQSALLLVLLAVSCVSAQVVVDSFSTAVGGPLGSPNGITDISEVFSSKVSSSNDALGAERDLTVSFVNVTPAYSNFSERVRGVVLNNQFQISVDTGVLGKAQLDWDGADNSQALNFNGIQPGRDLTLGGDQVSEC